LGLIIVDFDLAEQLLIRYFALVRYWRKKYELWDSVSDIYRLQEIL